MVGTTSTKTVTIEKRGAFHDDAFFKDSWDEWDKAMQDVVKKWDNESSALTAVTAPIAATPVGGETRSVYRKIRSSNVTSDDSQAVSCTEEDDKYKVVIDVRDFKPEDINVKTVDDTVVVEGKVEKKEGNSISTQKFVRRFLLPPGIDLNRIGSALSRDGVLTINAPKLAIKNSSTGSRRVPVSHVGSSPSIKSYSSHLPAAGKPTYQDNEEVIPRKMSTTVAHMIEKPSNRNLSSMPPAGKPTYTPSTTIYSTTATVGSSSPRGSLSSSTTSGSPNRQHVTETFTIDVPDRRGSGTVMNQNMSTLSTDHWNSFNDMVERSQKEMDDMMKRHTLHTSLEPPPSLPRGPNFQTSTPSSSIIAVPSNGVSTTKDVTRDGNKVTKREEHRWDDNPAPGMSRTNRARTEASTVKNTAGDVIGTSDQKQQHSHAEGGHEETLPDGTKVRSFTKNYETRNFYAVNSNGAKAL